MDMPYRIRIYRRYGSPYFGLGNKFKYTTTFEDVFTDNLTDAISLKNRLKNKYPIQSIMVFWGDNIIDSYNIEQP